VREAERLLIESEIARLTLLLEPRSEELLICVDEMHATGSPAEEICRRCGRSSRAISRTLSDARQLIRVLALELRPHVMQFEGVPQ